MRPRPLIAIAWLFIVVGAGGVLKDVLPLVGPHGGEAFRQLLQGEGATGLALIWAVRLLAVVGGVFLLRGHNWARWMLIAWMLFHIAISLFHSPLEAVLHVVIFAAIGYVLFRPGVSAYLGGEWR